jgi:succinate dehydrogenase / fumarate reductase, iron-sulfur subunit
MTLEENESQEPAESVRFKIKRQDSSGSPPRWEEHALPGQPGLSVRAALDAINQRLEAMTHDGTGTRALDLGGSCHGEGCGNCAMIINGHAAQACTVAVEDLEQPIELRPLTKFPLLRDLAVDRARVVSDLARVHATIDLARSACTGCGCCLEACPSYGPQSKWIGAAAVYQAHRFDAQSGGDGDRAARLDALLPPGGISDCGNAQVCVEVCPAGLPLTTALAETMRATVRHAFASIFRFRK